MPKFKSLKYVLALSLVFAGVSYSSSVFAGAHGSCPIIQTWYLINDKVIPSVAYLDNSSLNTSLNALAVENAFSEYYIQFAEPEWRNRKKCRYGNKVKNALNSIYRKIYSVEPKIEIVSDMDDDCFMRVNFFKIYS